MRTHHMHLYAPAHARTHQGLHHLDAVKHEDAIDGLMVSAQLLTAAGELLSNVKTEAYRPSGREWTHRVNFAAMGQGRGQGMGGSGGGGGGGGGGALMLASDSSRYTAHPPPSPRSFSRSILDAPGMPMGHTDGYTHLRTCCDAQPRGEAGAAPAG